MASKGGGSTKATFIIEARDDTQKTTDQIQGKLVEIEKQMSRMSKVSPMQGMGSKGQAEAGQAEQAVKSLIERFKEGNEAAGKLIERFTDFGLKAGAVGLAVGAVTALAMALDGAAEKAYSMEQASATLQIDITKARDAFKGMVADVDIAKSANKAFALGVVTNGADFAKLAAGVSQISKNLGEDQTKLLDDAVSAIGRRSSAILDNLGIQMSQEKAEQLYAITLEKTVQELTEYEKASAFAAMAIEEISKASKDASHHNASTVEQWKKNKVMLENMANSGWGFDSMGGKIRETLRSLDEETLKAFGSGKVEDIEKINNALQGSGLAYEDITGYVAETHNLEEDSAATQALMLAARGEEGNKLEYQAQLLAGMLEMGEEALSHQTKVIDSAARLDKIEAERLTRLAAGEEITAAEHEVAVLQAMGATEAEIIQSQRESLMLRLAEAEATKDVAGATAARNKLELLALTEIFKKKKKGGGSGPTEADRVKQVNEGITKELTDQIKLIELQAKLSGRESNSLVGLAERRLDLEHQQLEAELEVLSVTRAKNGVERMANAQREAEIARQMEIIQLEAANEAREHSLELIDQAVAASVQKAQIESRATARVIELDQYRLTNEQAQLEQSAQLRMASAKTDRERFEIQADLEKDLHRNRLAQIEAEQRAKERAFSLQETELSADSGADKDALQQLHHDRTISRLQSEMEMRQALNDEAARIGAAEQARLQQSLAQMQTMADGVFQIQGQVSSIVQTEIGRTRGIEDQEHAAKMQQWSTESQTQQANLDKQIAAAKDNTALQSRLRAQKAKLEESNRKRIEDAEAKHQDKRKRQEMRFAGVQMLIQAAISTGKAVSSYPDFVGMGIHAASAVLNTAYGIALMSGVIPSGGGAGNGGSSGGGASGVGIDAGAGKESSGAALTPESMPGTAAKMNTNGAITGSGSKGGFVNQGTITINASGAVDKNAAEQIGLAIGQAAYSREGASR